MNKGLLRGVGLRSDNTSIANISYTSGAPQAISGVGWNAAIGYDNIGRISTYTENGITKTITYNSDGTVYSYL